MSIPINVIAMTLSLFTGLALYAVHAGCDPILKGDVKSADELIPLFVIQELANIPGMLGLFTSCMFCAVLRFVSDDHFYILGIS